MSTQVKAFRDENLTHISNYSGDYDPANTYQKFDFVYYTGDGRYYYAKQDTVDESSPAPSEDPEFWETDKFFFDADYGSTVNFRANNFKHQFGNGYYILQPKNINSLTFEASLKFTNRTNREANAIIHFLENHQGQHEVDMPSPNLKYSQGISGFRWDGDATFYPYDTTNNQTKTFYCNEWSHDLAFENNNNISVKIRNLDNSLLNKSDELFVARPGNYSSNQYYEKNDIVFNEDNQRYYYWSGDSTQINKSPTQEQSEWTREYGYHQDINTEHWTREFFWKPSIGLNVSQKPRMTDISMGAGYGQIYRDGINESLLVLDLQFNNRTDEEARAILHFLEQHYGCIPFDFSPPAPYEKKKNFVCQEWSHTYNYKNNHSISAKFEQFPFNLNAGQYDNLITQPLSSPAQLTFSSPVVFNRQDDQNKLKFDEKLRHRLLLKNQGNFDLQIESISIESMGEAEFRIIGQQGPSDIPVFNKNIAGDDYVIMLPPGSNLPFDLNNKEVKISKSFTPGLDGGFSFKVTNGDSFFQNNRGHIINMTTGEVDKNKNDFVYENFVRNNAINVIRENTEAYLDMEFLGIDSEDFAYDFVYQKNGENVDLMWQLENESFGGNLQGYFSERFFYGKVIIKSNSLFGDQEGLLKIYLNT